MARKKKDRNGGAIRCSTTLILLPHCWAAFFYPHGISTNPTQVFIGKDDWLYLGEQYEKTVTSRRHQPTVQDAELARIIAGATTSWDQWLNLKGVSMFRVMLGPDKNTVYPEFLPDWAQQASSSTTDSLLANDSKGLYVDTRNALRTAKARFSESLYYKTDTHWNSLGAWVAFRAFEAEIARSEPGLRLLSDNEVRVSKVSERQGGDLAKFLRMKETLRDSEVLVDILSEHPIEIEQYEFDTGRLKKAGGNPQIHTARQPLLVKSKHALNDKKVLWLRDSFGTAMAPFMAATFSETLQIHYETADTALLARLVETFKPDYVFVTVVERAARRKRFGSVPPLITSSKKPSDFTSVSQGMPAGTHDLVKARNSEAYRVVGCRSVPDLLPRPSGACARRIATGAGPELRRKDGASAGAGIVARRRQAIQRGQQRPLRRPAGNDGHQFVAACVMDPGRGGYGYPGGY